MKTWLAITVVLTLVIAAAFGGYWAGFQDAWDMGLRADAAPRGAIAVAQLQRIERNRIDDVKLGLEHDIDMGLIHWHDLSKSQVRPFINLFSGADVVPDYERYVRRLAAYRKAHPSTLSDPAMAKSLVESSAKVSPERADDMRKGRESSLRALNEMVETYGK